MAEIPKEIAEGLEKIGEYFEHLNDLGIHLDDNHKLKQFYELFKCAKEMMMNYRVEEKKIIEKIIVQCKSELLLR